MTIHLRRALDALESVRLSPTSSRHWQRLYQLAVDLGPEKQQVIDQVIALPLATADAEWLRCSALASLTRDSSWFARQAALVGEGANPDAVLTLLNLAWFHALTLAPSREQLISQMRQVDAARLQRVAAQRLPQAGAARQLDAGRPLRIALYTPQVQSKRHGGTGFMLNIMSMLAGTDATVHAFSAQETAIPGCEGFCGGGDTLIATSAHTESLSLHVPGSIRLTLPDVELSVRARFAQIQSAIAQYAPDLVLFVGFMSPLVYHLYEHYPVLGLSVHSIPPLAPVDVWLGADEAGEPACWPALPSPALWHFPYRFWPQPAGPALERAAAGLPAQGTLLVTVGYRLAKEIGAPWSERMVAFLDAQPDAHWLLLGVPEGEYPASLPQHPRIHCRPPTPQVVPLLALCDIYVNPPRLGGGGSVALAMEQGLPVAAYVDSDGADKIGGLAANSDEAYFAQLAGWVNNAAARREDGDAMRARFLDRLDSSSVQARASLIRACGAAVTIFQSRKQQNHV